MYFFKKHFLRIVNKTEIIYCHVQTFTGTAKGIYNLPTI